MWLKVENSQNLWNPFPAMPLVAGESSGDHNRTRCEESSSLPQPINAAVNVSNIGFTVPLVPRRVFSGPISRYTSRASCLVAEGIQRPSGFTQQAAGLMNHPEDTANVFSQRNQERATCVGFTVAF